MQAEISYDLVMQDDMCFIEGTYRLPGRRWQVVIVSRSPEVTVPEVSAQTRESGVSGIHVRSPNTGHLNAEVLGRLLSEAFGVSEWVRVRGPDSVQLR